MKNVLTKPAKGSENVTITKSELIKVLQALEGVKRKLQALLK